MYRYTLPYHATYYAERPELLPCLPHLLLPGVQVVPIGIPKGI
nr:MAG TPA: hypothetical protein [Caudoviricetes sp.]